MNIPKEIIICGRKYKILFDKNNGGGSFDAGKCQLTIGTKYRNDIANIFLHETIEAIIAERGHRWRMWENTNEKLLFNFNHAEFENIITDIAFALNGIRFDKISIKEKRDGK